MKKNALLDNIFRVVTIVYIVVLAVDTVLGIARIKDRHAEEDEEDWI
jgi:hypothetical protein